MFNIITHSLLITRFKKEVWVVIYIQKLLVSVHRKDSPRTKNKKFSLLASPKNLQIAVLSSCKPKKPKYGNSWGFSTPELYKIKQLYNTIFSSYKQKKLEMAEVFYSLSFIKSSNFITSKKLEIVEVFYVLGFIKSNNFITEKRA